VYNSFTTAQGDFDRIDYFNNDFRRFSFFSDAGTQLFKGCTFMQFPKFYVSEKANFC